MPKVGDIFPSKYIKPDDLKGQAVTMTIKEVKLEDAFGSTKPVIYFAERDKAMTVSPTNARIITQLLEDDETDHWAGAKITISTSMQPIAGQLKKVINVTAAWFDRNGQQAYAVPASAPVNAPAPPVTDDIPF
jgi:hypothetical protein